MVLVLGCRGGSKASEGWSILSQVTRLVNDRVTLKGRGLVYRAREGKACVAQWHRGQVSGGGCLDVPDLSFLTCKWDDNSTHP